MIVQSVLIFWNRKEYAKACFESYLRSTKYPHTLIVADNFSTDGTREYLKGMEEDYLRGKLNTNNIKLIFRYYDKNFGPIRVENHCIRNPIDNDTEYFVRGFTDLDYSLMGSGDWLEMLAKLMDNVPEIACAAPTDREWPESDNIRKNGEVYVGGAPFEFSEEIKITRKEIYQQFGRPMFNMWAETPSYFTACVRNSWNMDKTFKWDTAVHPNIKIKHLTETMGLEKTNDFYKKHQLISRRVYSKNRAFMDSTGGMLEWMEAGSHKYDVNELVGEMTCRGSQMDNEGIEAAIDLGIKKSDLELLEKDGIKYIEWPGTKERQGW